MSEARSKYNAKKTEVDGFVFDSRAEARRYSELMILEKAGEISELQLQPVFPIFIKGKLICHYMADFGYKEKGKWIVEDVKGVKTPVYRLKKKMVEAAYDIKITEVTA